MEYRSGEGVRSCLAGENRPSDGPSHRLLLRSGKSADPSIRPGGGMDGWKDRSHIRCRDKGIGERQLVHEHNFWRQPKNLIRGWSNSTHHDHLQHFGLTTPFIKRKHSTDFLNSLLIYCYMHFRVSTVICTPRSSGSIPAT